MWGPERLTPVTQRGLRQRVADDLDVPMYRVRLVNGSQLVDGESSLESGELQLQLILEDPKEVIREVQSYLCCEVAPGLSKEELHRAEERYKVRRQ